MIIQEQNREIKFESGNTIIMLSIDYSRNSYDLSSPNQDTLISVKGNNINTIKETENCLKEIRKYLTKNTKILNKEELNYLL